MVTLKETHQLIEKGWETNLPVFLWGAPGIGKTAIVKQITEAKKIQFLDIRLSEFDEVDLRGLPALNHEKKETTWYVPDFLPKDANWTGIIFFDELPNARPSVQNVALKIIHEGAIGNWHKPKGALFIAAGNRAEDRAHVFELSAPLQNRFALHCEIEASGKEFTEWLIENNKDHRIISYLNFKPSHLHTLNNKEKTHAFATPRTWDYLSTLIHNEKDEKRIRLLSTACMGEGVGIEFTAFVKLYENYNIKEILENPDEFEYPTKLDELWSFVGAVAHYTKTVKDKKILTNALKITNKLEPEYATLLLKMIMEGKKNIKQFDEIPEFTKTITRLGKYF